MFQVLSDRTCNDLDFEELFGFLDRTNSKVGQQYLYNVLRSISDDSKNSERNETIISKLAEDGDLRVKVQRELAKLDSFDTYYISSLFQEEHIRPPKHFFIFKLLSFASILLFVYLLRFSHNLFLFFFSFLL